MIITRTPFRISFFGGGTDYPVWYEENGGAVLSTTINKYCYISCRYLPPFFDYKYRIRYSHREETKVVNEIKHPSVRECLKLLKIEKGIEMVHTSDIPAMSGIGSSSAFTVGFLQALYALKGKIVTKRHLAREAISMEQDVLKENVGSQDQIAAAFGGFNKVEFGGNRGFYVTPMTIGTEKMDLLQDHLMLFFTGYSRTASDVAAEQIRKTASKGDELRAMGEMVDEAINVLNRDRGNITDFGKFLHESWMYKRGLTKLISTNKIDEMYEVGRSAGAIGGKLLGAGGGGFLLFFAKPEDQQKIKEKLKGLLHVPFRFEPLGSQIIMYATQDFY
ncbi:MAG: kinase [Deltaproteobacteria bacterium]|nr:kinase [Deltaproteobacteria bacterium]